MNDTDAYHHYTESGLDNVYLVKGAAVVVDQRPSGQVLKIKDIEGLHRAIGLALAFEKKNLTGKEIRFLRHELLLSQATLAKLLGVTEQTVHRWEAGKADIPKPAENLVRSLYLSQQTEDKNDGFDIKKALEELADLDDQINVLKMKRTKTAWQMEKAAA